MNNLKDKTAIVTGASRGIGRAIALNPLSAPKAATPRAEDEIIEPTYDS